MNSFSLWFWPSNYVNYLCIKLHRGFDWTQALETHCASKKKPRVAASIQPPKTQNWVHLLQNKVVFWDMDTWLIRITFSYASLYMYAWSKWFFSFCVFPCVFPAISRIWRELAGWELARQSHSSLENPIWTYLVIMLEE